MMGHYIALSLLAVLGLGMIFIFYLTVKGRTIERRFVFLYIVFTVSLPLFVKMKPPIQVSPEVQQVVETITSLSPGAKVLISCDFDPPSAPELQPMLVAFTKYALKHDLKLIFMGLWPLGPSQANRGLRLALADTIIAAKNLTYGVDYVNLGFQSGNEFVIQAMGGSFKSMFPQDDRRIPYDSIPLLNGVVNYRQIDLVMNFSAGKPGTIEWIQNAVDRYQVKLSAGNTAVQAPQVYPYLRAGQVRGLMGGMSGAAEFELALNEKGKASSFILSQMFSHLAVMLFVIVGNVAWLMTRKKK